MSLQPTTRLSASGRRCATATRATSASCRSTSSTRCSSPRPHSSRAPRRSTSKTCSITSAPNEVKTPRGAAAPRWKLFDCALRRRARSAGRSGRGPGARLPRARRTSCARARVNKLILLHGPNGSAKSTFVSCIARALEHYSHARRGRAYRFNWIFPSQKLQKGGIGFGGRGYEAPAGRQLRLPRRRPDRRRASSTSCRDNPLLLIAAEKRAGALRRAAKDTPTSRRRTTSATAISATRTSRSSRRCSSPTRATT